MSGVYATIEKKPNGTYALNYVLVRRFNARLHQSLNYLLRVPERTRAAKCLNVLKDAIRDCVYIGEAEVCFSNDRGFPFAFGDTRREYLVWSLDGKSIFCVPDSLLLEEAGEEYEDSGTRTFKTREAAEDFVFTHYYVRDEVSLLWDLDTNLFTWFVPTVPKKYAEHASCLRAYDFKNDCFTTCFEVTYSLDEMEAGGEERELEIVSGMPDRKIVSAHTDAEEKPAKDSEPDDAFTFASTDSPGKLTYSMREETPLLVSGSIYSLRAMGPSVNIDRQFTGLTYTATFDARFGFETWVYRLMQDGKQVWRTSIPADSYDGIKSSLLEGLCATVISLVKYPPSKEMYKGLYYNDLDHVFESKILRTVETSLYRHLMEKTAPYGQKRISGLTKLLKDTLHRVDSAKNTEERKRLMARLVAYDPQADEFTLIPGGKEEVFREGGPKKGWFYFAYSVIVAAPVFVPEFDEGDLVSSVQVYTKEGYSQETIALLLGMTVKQVSDIQKAGR